MTDEIRSLEKTLKSFRRETRYIAKTSGVDQRTGILRIRRRAARLVGAALLASQVLFIVFPPFSYPVSGEITSGYTIRRKPDRMGLAIEAHRGIDIAAAPGTAVKSAAPGKVHATGWSDTSGNYVLVRHLFGFSTYYAHLQSINSSEGSLTLFRLLPIGLAGNTGRSTGSHVHFEIRFLGMRLPPRPFLVYHAVRRALFR